MSEPQNSKPAKIETPLEKSISAVLLLFLYALPGLILSVATPTIYPPGYTGGNLVFSLPIFWVGCVHAARCTKSFLPFFIGSAMIAFPNAYGYVTDRGWGLDTNYKRETEVYVQFIILLRSLGFAAFIMIPPLIIAAIARRFSFKQRNQPRGFPVEISAAPPATESPKDPHPTARQP